MGVSVYDMSNFCIKNNFFTCGSGNQYSKLFDMVENDEPLEDIALVIWLCSDDKFTRNEILGKLKVLYNC